MPWPVLIKSSSSTILRSFPRSSLSAGWLMPSLLAASVTLRSSYRATAIGRRLRSKSFFNALSPNLYKYYLRHLHCTILPGDYDSFQQSLGVDNGSIASQSKHQETPFICATKGAHSFPYGRSRAHPAPNCRLGYALGHKQSRQQSQVAQRYLDR